MKVTDLPMAFKAMHVVKFTDIVKLNSMYVSEINMYNFKVGETMVRN